MNAKELQQDPEFTSKRDELEQAMRVLDAELKVLEAKQAALERRIGQQLQQWADQYPDVTIRLDTNYRFTVTDVVADIEETEIRQSELLAEAVNLLAVLAVKPTEVDLNQVQAVAAKIGPPLAKLFDLTWFAEK